MKYLKLFESFDFDKELIHSAFDDLDTIDIQRIDLISLAGLKEFKSFSQSVNLKKLSIHPAVIKHFPIHVKNLFNESNFTDCVDWWIINSTTQPDLQDQEFMIVQFDFYHPQMVRNASFPYETYIKQVIAHRLKQIHQVYNMDVFVWMPRIDYTYDPILKNGRLFFIKKY
jgi:hypothetical protein